MNDQTQDFAEQGTAFQKIWLESMSKVIQAAGAFSPASSASPEMVGEIRNGLLRALGESWDDFLRSPEFLKEMKQTMDNATAFRLMSNDFMAKMRNEMQAPSRNDVDAIQLNVRHMEKRILDRLETMSKQIAELNGRTNGAKPAAAKPQTTAKPHAAKSQATRKGGKR